tara:strand:- start:4353 stop:5432 length:1080 start_codon:yes stop_codon:yes gene_type:complete
MLIPTPKDYKPSGKILSNTSDMSPDDFSEMKQKYSRLGYFSASQSPALLGIYSSATQVFDEMRQERPKDLSDTKSWDKIIFGRLIEDWIGDYASEMIGVDVFNDPYMIGNRQHSWICCNKDFHLVDNDIYKGRWAMETKSTSNWQVRKKLGLSGSSDTVPQYYIQIQHQCLVDDLDGCINPVLVIKDPSSIPMAVDAIESGEDVEDVMDGVPYYLNWYVVERDEEVVAELRDHLIRMREIFHQGGQPPIDGSEATSKVLRNKERSGGLALADEEVMEMIDKIKIKKDQIKTEQESIKEIENSLLAKLGEHEGYQYEGASVMSVKQITSNRFNSTKFKDENPEMAKEYNMESTYTKVEYG